MSKSYTILMLDDEPLILMDLEFAAEDRACHSITTTTCDAALRMIEEKGDAIDVAILDVSLGHGKTCFPVASELERRKIPFILHSADLDRHDERIRKLQAELIAKPASAEKVVAAAIVHSEGADMNDVRLAAE